MNGGKTLWEMAVEWWKGKPKVEFYDPLGGLGKQAVSIDVMEFRDYNFRLRGVKELTLDYGNRKFKFTDYLCESILGDSGSVKVRVYPPEAVGKTCRTLLLQQIDVIDYASDFEELLKDEMFNVHEDDVKDSFWRINGVKTPYKATVSEKGVENQSEIWYHDYWRDTVDEVGTDYKEFLFVEQDKSDTGQFVIWRGSECPVSRIIIT